VAEGVRNQTRKQVDEAALRVRAPRVIGPMRLIAPYDEDRAITMAAAVAQSPEAVRRTPLLTHTLSHTYTQSQKPDTRTCRAVLAHRQVCAHSHRSVFTSLICVRGSLSVSLCLSVCAIRAPQFKQARLWNVLLLPERHERVAVTDLAVFCLIEVPLAASASGMLPASLRTALAAATAATQSTSTATAATVPVPFQLRLAWTVPYKDLERVDRMPAPTTSVAAAAAYMAAQAQAQHTGSQAATVVRMHVRHAKPTDILCPDDDTAEVRCRGHAVCL
jgi:hypothetical protein